MKLSPLNQIQIAAVLGTAFVLLGCEAPATSASEQTPPVYPAISAVGQPDLVTVTNLVPEAPATPPVKLPDRLQEVVKLAQSGVGDDVILAYIQNSPVPFNPTPDEILYLTDLGISDVIITALVNHGAGPVAGAAQPAGAPAPSAPPALVQTAPAQPTYNPEPAYDAQPVYNPEPQVVYSAPPVVEYSYFYSSLAPYGSWVDVSDYGWCWQPTVAVMHHDWRPYGDRGRWLSTDCGWYWQSDYSWGWAPFHYGRWFHHPARGWCWRPDSTWGPAWVSWRYSDSHCGWAPLPPGAHYAHGVGFTYYGAHVSAGFGFGLHLDAWTFVPAGRMHDRDVWRYRASAGEHTRVFHNSRVINNYAVRDNHVINEGITRDRVPALGRSEVRKIAVRDLPERPGAGFQPDRLRQEGSDVVVYRPKPPVTSGNGGRSSGTDATRAIASQPVSTPASPMGSRGANNPSLTSRNGAEAANVAPSLGSARSEPAVSSRPVTSAGTGSERREVVKPSVAAPGTAVPAGVASGPAQSSGTPRQNAEVRSAPTAVTQQPQAVTPRTFRVPTSPGTAVRTEPSSSGSTPTPSRQAASPSAPRAVPQATPTVRQEPPNVTVFSPQQSGQTGPASQPQSYRVPAPVSNPSWNPSGASRGSSSPSFQRSAPQAVSPPTATFRQEVAKPASPVAPERRTYSAPTPAYEAPRAEPVPAYRSAAPSFSRPALPTYSAPQPSRPTPTYSAPQPSRPTPTYSAPQPSRPTPTYSAPAVQSRPAQSTPSFSLPASRPAPQAAPAPTQTGRSGNRRQL